MPTPDIRQQANFASVKAFASKREKVLRFAVPNGLEHGEDLRRDLAVLRRQGWQKLPQPQSQVWMEHNTLQHRLINLQHPGRLWELVYSDSWAGYGCLRVCEGSLLQQLLLRLHALIHTGAIHSYKTARFDTLTLPHTSTVLKPHARKYDKIVPVKITFTYYGLAEGTSEGYRFDSPIFYDTNDFDDQSAKDPECLSKYSSGDGSESTSSKECKSMSAVPSMSSTSSIKVEDYEMSETISEQSVHHMLALEGQADQQMDDSQGQEMADPATENTCNAKAMPQQLSVGTIESMFPAKKKVIPPENVYTEVNFEFDENQKLKDHLEEISDSETKIEDKPATTPHDYQISCPSRNKYLKNERAFLTDKREHFIGGRGYLDSPCSTRLAKENVIYDHIDHISDQNKAQNLKGKNHSMQSEERNPKSNQRRMSVYLHMIEHTNNSLCHSPLQAGNYHHSTEKQVPALIQAINERRNWKPFIPLNTSRLNRASSITRMKRIEHHRKIRDSIPSPSANREFIQHKLDQFLHDKILPRIQQNGTPPKSGQYKLFPTAYAPVAPRHLEPILHPDIEKQPIPRLFPQDVQTSFLENWLMRSIQDFIIRKEQVTFGDNWKTVTSITINHVNRK